MSRIRVPGGIASCVTSFPSVTEAEWAAALTAAVIPAGEPIWFGLDVGWKWDTTAIVPLWVESPEFRLLGDAEILTPPRDANSLNPDEIKQAILRMNERNPIHTVVMDMTRAEDIANWISSELQVTVIDRPQGNAMAALDYERFMEALRQGWLRHTGEPGLTRHVLNAVTKLLPGGGARFDRSSQTRQGGDQERRVIDALIAAAMVNTAASDPSEVIEPFAMNLVSGPVHEPAHNSPKERLTLVVDGLDREICWWLVTV